MRTSDLIVCFIVVMLCCLFFFYAGYQKGYKAGVDAMIETLHEARDKKIAEREG